MKKWGIVVFLLIVLVAGIRAQDRPRSITDNEKKAVVAAVADVLAKQYVFPETARKMGDLIKKNLKAGKYAVIDDPQAFALKLSEDLLSVSRDKHLGVSFAPQRILKMKTPDEAKKKAATVPARSFSRAATCTTKGRAGPK